jgi:hypothetical protein
MSNLAKALICTLVVTSLSCGPQVKGTAVELTGGEGLGFNDIEYSTDFHRVVVPGGRTGKVYFVDPDDNQVNVIGGFSYIRYWDLRKEDGPTGVGFGRGFVMVTDRTSTRLSVVDPAVGKIVGSAAEQSGGVGVRFVPTTNEIWLTEPDLDQFEIYSLPEHPPLDPISIGTIPLHDHYARGPEEPCVDVTRRRVYATHFTPPGPGGSAMVMAFDMYTHALVDQWPSTCLLGHGMRLDETRGFLYLACGEGTVVAMDVANHGHIISSVQTNGANYDIMGIEPNLSHIYLNGDGCSCLNILGISAAGTLSILGTFDSPTGSQSVTADEKGHVWMADPYRGRLIKMNDPFPASR